MVFVSGFIRKTRSVVAAETNIDMLELLNAKGQLLAAIN